MLIAKIKKHFDVEDAELESFIVQDKQALLYDKEPLTYGQVDFILKDGTDRTKKSFWFNIDDVLIDLRAINNVEHDQEGYLTLEHPQKNKVIANHETLKIGFIFDGSKLVSVVN